MLNQFVCILRLEYTSKGANPSTRRKFEKNYFRFLDCFFGYSRDIQLSDLLHLRAFCSYFWKCPSVKSCNIFIVSVTNKVRKHGLRFITTMCTIRICRFFFFLSPTYLFRTLLAQASKCLRNLWHEVCLTDARLTEQRPSQHERPVFAFTLLVSGK